MPTDPSATLCKEAHRQHTDPSAIAPRHHDLPAPRPRLDCAALAIMQYRALGRQLKTSENNELENER